MFTVPLTPPGPPAKPSIPAAPGQTLGELAERLARHEQSQQFKGPFVRSLSGKPVSPISEWQGQAAYSISLSITRQEIESLDGFHELRTFALRAWGENLTSAVCHRLIGELLRRFPHMSAPQVEALSIREAADMLLSETAPPTWQEDKEPVTLRLLNVFTNGVSDERIRKAARYLSDSEQSANERLTKIDALIAIPPTASAERLGEMLEVSGAAIKKTQWWTENRKGEKAEEVGRRQKRLQERGKQHESSGLDDDRE